MSYKGRFFVWRGEQRRCSPLHMRGNTEGFALRPSLSREKTTPKTDGMGGQTLCAARGDDIVASRP